MIPKVRVKAEEEVKKVWGWQKKGNQENTKQLKRTDWEGMVHKCKRAQLSFNKSLFIKLGGGPP